MRIEASVGTERWNDSPHINIFQKRSFHWKFLTKIMEMIRVSSSAMDAIGYDPKLQRMYIMFHQGDTYTFCRVPQMIFDGLLAAHSKGRYYDQHIKDRYKC